MAIPIKSINDTPVVTVTAHAIVLYPNNKGYAIKHTYCADMDGDIHLLKNTLVNIIEQRFPHLLNMNFVTPDIYEKAVRDKNFEGFDIEEKDSVYLPSTILLKR